MKIQNITNILKTNPQLTDHGIVDPSAKLYDKFRKEIFNRTKEISECIDWLNKNYVRTKSKKYPISTYFIKHIIERDLSKYISNGELVAAVIALNIAYTRSSDPENPNLYLPIDLKQYNANKNGID